jgi:hypothetical protein
MTHEYYLNEDVRKIFVSSKTQCHPMKFIKHCCLFVVQYLIIDFKRKYLREFSVQESKNRTYMISFMHRKRHYVNGFINVKFTKCRKHTVSYPFIALYKSLHDLNNIVLTQIHRH